MLMRKPHATSIRVLLIDDHPVVRSGMARALADERDIEVVGECSTAADGVERAGELRPDVMLVDLALPDRDGPELIGALRQLVPDSKVLVVSGYDDEYRVAEALRAGAHGYLIKSATVDELVAGVRTVANGGTPLSPSLADVLMRVVHKSGQRSGKRSGTIDSLTARELQVLRLFASGLSTREVAQNLGISPKTVETHRIRMYEKLDCKSVVDLTRIAVRTGLVEA
jgi:two-component system, NarL family, nitrate/nitrite response regulator NarL